jgi:hypothetical protein
MPNMLLLSATPESQEIEAPSCHGQGCHAPLRTKKKKKQQTDINHAQENILTEPGEAFFIGPIAVLARHAWIWASGCFPLYLAAPVA